MKSFLDKLPQVIYWKKPYQELVSKFQTLVAYKLELKILLYKEPQAEHQPINNYHKTKRIKFNWFNCSDNSKKLTLLKVLQLKKSTDL